MFFDSLTNPEWQEERETVVRAYASDVQAWQGQIQSEAMTVEALLEKSERSYGAFLRDADAALNSFAVGVEAIARCLPPQSAFFRSSVGEEDFFRLCREIDRTEHAHRSLQALLLRAAELGESLRACHLRALRYQKDVYAVKITHPEDEVCAQSCARLRACAERCEAVTHRLMAARERLGELCFSLLPRFLEKLRDCTDLLHSGKDCDRAAICALCAELKRALCAINLSDGD